MYTTLQVHHSKPSSCGRMFGANTLAYCQLRLRCSCSQCDALCMIK